MNNSVSDSDLDLINLGNSLGLDLVSFAKLRESQEDEFTDIIREKAITKLERNNDNILENSNLFYAGSIDFMVCKDQGSGKKNFLLETNGASNRGLSILSKKQQKIMYRGYFEAIEKCINNTNQKDKKIIIVVGVPIDDGLIHEKVIMIEYFRNKIVNKGLTVGIFNLTNFDKDFKYNIAFLIADYKQLIPNLKFRDNWVQLNDIKIHILIGDGIARRIHDPIFENLIKNNLYSIKTIIINPIYIVTDDKSLTYLAHYYKRKKLEQYNTTNFLFSKAYDEDELVEKIKRAVNGYKIPFIIKPYGGSGGAGVMSIFPDEIMKNPSRIKEIINSSKEEFFKKFMNNRNPFPYTIQEMANFSLIDWRKAKHTFDIRIYLSQIRGKIVPIGGLIRIARDHYINGLKKEEFVVNLSGFDGRIEVDRGIGLSKKILKLLGLEIDHFIDIFCSSCIIFKGIVDNYKKLMEFSNWDKIIGSD
ncbi:MAG: hypothetical protein KGD63_01775 [Candidatus Lokiarchaeota archaeon]|nr:hypothetical protein [Candidatus Lokiarchaeota archaeon]